MTTAVPSPCVSICQMSPQTGLCVGCLRTIDEIANWAALANDEKLHILQLIEQRTP
ncbi:MAG: DUF1289 domain-containing protein [Cytophagales bacterium]|nr:DUF1289 domain-containing protein [Cytophagales bacterium]